MKLGIGERAIIKNVITRQYAYVDISDFYEYNGCYIAYGTRQRTGIYLPRSGGKMPVATGPSCLVICPQARPGQVELLRDMLRGLPLYVVDNPLAPLGVPILNMARTRGLGRDGTDRDALVDRAQRLVDIWQEWQETGRIPLWARQAQTAARTSVN